MRRGNKKTRKSKEKVKIMLTIDGKKTDERKEEKIIKRRKRKTRERDNR